MSWPFILRLCWGMRRKTTLCFVVHPPTRTYPTSFLIIYRLGYFGFSSVGFPGNFFPFLGCLSWGFERLWGVVSVLGGGSYKILKGFVWDFDIWLIRSTRGRAISNSVVYFCYVEGLLISTCMLLWGVLTSCVCCFVVLLLVSFGSVELTYIQNYVRCWLHFGEPAFL